MYPQEFEEEINSDIILKSFSKKSLLTISKEYGIRRTSCYSFFHEPTEKNVQYYATTYSLYDISMLENWKNLMGITLFLKSTDEPIKLSFKRFRNLKHLAIVFIGCANMFDYEIICNDNLESLFSYCTDCVNEIKHKQSFFAINSGLSYLSTYHMRILYQTKQLNNLKRLNLIFMKPINHLEYIYKCPNIKTFYIRGRTPIINCVLEENYHIYLHKFSDLKYFSSGDLYGQKIYISENNKLNYISFSGDIIGEKYLNKNTKVELVDPNLKSVLITSKRKNVGYCVWNNKSLYNYLYMQNTPVVYKQKNYPIY